MFIVPTTALVSQQARYIRSNSSVRGCSGERISVGEVCGFIIDSWTNLHWARALSSHDVLVGTPEVFRRALVDQGYLHPAVFSLLIFDECHNATSKSPMAAIMLDSIHKFWCREPQISQPCELKLPRILGLTASFVNGSLNNIESKRNKLEYLLQSNIISPDVPDFFENEKLFHKISYASDCHDLGVSEAVRSYIERILEVVPIYLKLIDRRDRVK